MNTEIERLKATLEGLNMVFGGRFVESLLAHLASMRCRDPRCMSCHA